MYPPVFQIASQSQQVKALLGESPTRLYLFGLAPQGVSYPYAVWQTVGGAPENYLDTRPNIDLFTVQFDVYATSATSARNVAMALRDVLERHAHVTSWRGESIDSETKSRRVSFDMDFWTNR